MLTENRNEYGQIIYEERNIEHINVKPILSDEVEKAAKEYKIEK